MGVFLRFFTTTFFRRGTFSQLDFLFAAAFPILVVNKVQLYLRALKRGILSCGSIIVKRSHHRQKVSLNYLVS